MNTHAIVTIANDPTNVLTVIGIITALATVGAFLPVRTGNGQHAGAGPGAVGVWHVRDYAPPRATAAAARPAATNSSPAESAPHCDTQPIGERRRERTATPNPTADLPPPLDQVIDPQPVLYSYRDLYRYDSTTREIPKPEAFDTIGLRLLDTPHSVEQPQEPAPAIGRCCNTTRRSTARKLDAPRTTAFEQLLDQGIRAALDPNPYIGRHRLHTAEPRRGLAHAA
ncbi:hypothetical protein [Parasphingorhabdus pacifica]